MTRTRPAGWRARMMRLLVLLCAGAVCLTGCDFSVYSLPLPGGADLGDHPITVRVQFRDVLDLVPESSVKVADVTVGKVDKISVDDWTADVTLVIRGDVKLPKNAEAEIRQTSLLGEKFVSLKAPETDPSAQRLADGDVIPLARSGRNPEVEEVLGAMSLLLNGGGVAQLKTIATELNKALDGRETDVRSLLDQLSEFMGQIDDNKQQIVGAIEKLNRLAKSLNAQRDTIELALDELPAAVSSLDRQRDDLVKMLKALTRLSDVGTRVIRDSKDATIASLRSLEPILTKLAEAGDAFPRSLQVFLTYPFVDSVVGEDPVVARNLHMGDYTNLSVQLDLDLTQGLPELPGLPTIPGVSDALKQLQQLCRKTPLAPVCKALLGPDGTPTVKKLKELCQQTPLAPVCVSLLGPKSPQPTPGPSLPLPLPTVSLPPIVGGGGGGDGGCTLLVLCRPAPGPGVSGGERSEAIPEQAGSYDPDLGALLVWGLVKR